MIQSQKCKKKPHHIYTREEIIENLKKNRFVFYKVCKDLQISSSTLLYHFILCGITPKEFRKTMMENIVLEPLRQNIRLKYVLFCDVCSRNFNSSKKETTFCSMTCQSITARLGSVVTAWQLEKANDYPEATQTNILDLLKEHANNYALVAKILGISDNGLRNKVKGFGLDPKDPFKV